MVDRSKKNHPPAPQDRRNSSLPPRPMRFRRMFNLKVQVEVKVPGVDGSGFREFSLVAESAEQALELASTLVPVAEGETEVRRFIAGGAEFEPEHAKKWGEWLDQTERAAAHWGGNQHRDEDAPTTTAAGCEPEPPDAADAPAEEPAEEAAAVA
ncbi:MAG: hypothetical protein AB7I38_16995 [Dehalococcoidia bacterium]